MSISRFSFTSLFGLVWLHLFCGCAIQEPTVTIQNVSISNATIEQVSLLFDLNVDNPNNASFDLFSFDYEILLDGKPTLSGNQEVKQRIHAATATKIQVPLTLHLGSLYQNVLNLLSKPKDPNYLAKFQLYFDLPLLGRTRVPVSKEGTLPISSALSGF